MRYQQYPYSCGAAAITNAFRAYGYKIAERRIRAVAGTTENGTDEDGVLAAVRYFGFKAIEYSTNSGTEAWSWLCGTLSQGKPVILCTEAWEHWTVAVGMLGNRAIIIDSSNFKKNKSENGVHVWSRPWLMKKWKNGRKSVEGNRFYAIAVSK